MTQPQKVPKDEPAKQRPSFGERAQETYASALVSWLATSAGTWAVARFFPGVLASMHRMAERVYDRLTPDANEQSEHADAGREKRIRQHARNFVDGFFLPVLIGLPNFVFSKWSLRRQRLGGASDNPGARIADDVIGWTAGLVSAYGVNEAVNQLAPDQVDAFVTKVGGEQARAADSMLQDVQSSENARATGARSFLLGAAQFAITPLINAATAHQLQNIRDQQRDNPQ